MAEPWLPVLDFWFRELTPEDWFAVQEKVDAAIADRFGDLVGEARNGKLDHWTCTPRGRLALIIVLDQFPRNLFRDDARAYAADPKATALVLEGLEKGMDRVLTLSERQFFYMPLMHAEDLAIQAKSVELFEGLVDDSRFVLDFARGHRNLIARFGRFPLRNKALGRASSPVEQAYLEAGGGYPADEEEAG